MVENSLKQRIIGAVVLIALAIIFLPAILKEKISNGEFESKIPKMPPILEEYQVDTDAIDRLAKQPTSQLEQELAKQEQQVAKRDAAEQKSLEKSTRKSNPSAESSPQSSLKPANVKTHKESLSPDFQDAAWVLQVASFSQSANAKKLVKKLKKQGLKAYRRSISVKGKKLYRVFVGPFVDKAQATKNLKQVSNISQTEAIIKAFDPNYH